MGEVVNIPAGAEPEPEQTEEGLSEALDAAEEAVAKIQTKRQKVRDKTPKPDLLAALAETDDDAADAVAALEAARKAHGRFTRGGGKGQKVPVGSAKEGEG